jgi:hypothetical protein
LVLKKEEYLATITDGEERRRMSALRGGTHPLRIETGRWRGELLQDRTCTLCAKGEIEDEEHVLLCCSTYERERSELYRCIQGSTNYDLSNERQRAGTEITDWWWLLATTEETVHTIRSS